MFAVPLFAKELKKIADSYGINVHFQTNLVAVDSANRKATFKVVGGEKEGQTVSVRTRIRASVRRFGTGIANAPLLLLDRIRQDTLQFKLLAWIVC